MTNRPTSKVPWRWVPFAKNFFVADCLGHGAVQVQRGNGGASGGADAEGTNSVPTKMQSPRVATGIEQTNFLSGLRVTRGESCSFAQRTRDAGQSEIFEGCFAVGVDGNDVVNVEGRFLRGLGKAAVFAAILRPKNDLTPKLRRYGHAVSGGRCSIVGNADGAGKAVRRGQPNPRLRAFRRASSGRPDPVCRAGRRGASALPWAAGTSKDRPAALSQIGWPETYFFPVINPQNAGASR